MISRVSGMTSALSIKLRCASWQQLATIYKRDLSRGTMFLKASNPPPIGTTVRIDLTLPSASVIVLTGTVEQHVTDPQRGSGVDLKLAPIPTSSIWLIESALAAEAKRISTPASGVPAVVGKSTSGPNAAIGDGEDLAAAEGELVRALASEAESLKKLNPFLVLGVGYEAGDAEVRAAFGELTKRYHPDRFARYESTELRQVAAEIFILIRDAYRKLGDDASRAQVLASLGRPAPAPRAVPSHRASTPPPRPPRLPSSTGGNHTPPPQRATIPERASSPNMAEPLPPPPVPPPATPRASPHEVPTARATGTPDAPSQLTAALAAPTVNRAVSPAVRRSATPTAEPPARPTGPITSPLPATLASPGAAAAPSSSGDAGSLEDLVEANQFDAALEGYRQLARKQPQDRVARAGVELCEGLLALAQRDRLEAAQRFEAALEIDPSNERAARELAEMRRQATNERKGLLSRLMGKKE